ncbi:TPA: hypothetical protein ACF54Y_005103 [Klebsiella variicola]
MTDITELAQSEINDALAQLKQISEYPTPSTQYARVLRKYILALEKALEKAQRANAAQDDHINQQQDRIDILERRNAELGGELSRYSMSPGQADQRMCESRAARDALGFGKDADDVAPINLRERIDGMTARIAELESQLKAAENNEIDACCHIAELESRTVSVKLLTPEVRNALKAEGLADVLKDAAEYAPLTAGQWETLTKNWYQTFIGLSGFAAGIKVEAE